MKLPELKIASASLPALGWALGLGGWAGHTLGGGCRLGEGMPGRVQGWGVCQVGDLCEG